MHISASVLLDVAIIVIALFGIVLWFLRLREGVLVQKRYKKFALDPLKNNEIPLFDKILSTYEDIKVKMSKYLVKSAVLKDYSKKYEKYLSKVKNKKTDAMNYISAKFIWGFIFIVIVVVSYIIRFKIVSFTGISGSFLVGFFAPDIYWVIANKTRKKQVEKDMLKAIIIMNNSFKSGLSIMQAIYMVSNELGGPIAEEFKKMYIDISFGLDMDLVFKRFAKRINTEEAHYISTSLSVLNKTGGNIVQVFSSVERSAFTRKKLEDELKSLSASANAIYKILVSIPVFLIGIIMVLNPAYFAPLIKNKIGNFILIVIISMYIVYIIIIRRIVKAKE